TLNQHSGDVLEDGPLAAHHRDTPTDRHGSEDERGEHEPGKPDEDGHRREEEKWEKRREIADSGDPLQSSVLDGREEQDEPERDGEADEGLPARQWTSASTSEPERERRQHEHGSGDQQAEFRVEEEHPKQLQR